MKISLFQVQPLNLPQQKVGSVTSVSENSFADILMDKIQTADALQKKANSLTEKMLAGEDIDLHEVMIATEKAEVAMQLTLQIRNKLLEAYQELTRMQI